MWRCVCARDKILTIAKLITQPFFALWPQAAVSEGFSTSFIMIMAPLIFQCCAAFLVNQLLGLAVLPANKESNSLSIIFRLWSKLKYLLLQKIWQHCPRFRDHGNRKPCLRRMTNATCFTKKIMRLSSGEFIFIFIMNVCVFFYSARPARRIENEAGKSITQGRGRRFLHAPLGSDEGRYTASKRRARCREQKKDELGCCRWA